jgi:hypothetical protein
MFPGQPGDATSGEEIAMPTLIYITPEYVRQTRMNSCWYACFKMFKSFHTGSRHVSNAPQIKSLKSHFKGRSYSDLDPTELMNAVPGVQVSMRRGETLSSSQAIYNFLEQNGPFMGGGKVGMFGIGHAIFIFGVTSTHIIYHDPAPGYGPNCRRTITDYAQKQDGEIIWVQNGGKPAKIGSMGS